MSDHSTTTAEVPALIEALVVLLQAHAAAYKQERTFRRAVGLVLGELFAFGRRTVTQGLLALGLGEHDWSAWYRLFSRGRFDEAAAGEVLLRVSLAHVAACEPYVVGTDGVRFERSSQKMPGTGWLPALGTACFRRGLKRAQRFVHGAWLAPLTADGYSRAIPLRLLPAFPEKAVAAAGVKSCREWEAGLGYVQWVRQALDAAGRAAQMVLWLADGSYDVLELWRQLPARCILVVRTARNRALYALPEPELRVGRPAAYGEQALHPAQWLRLRKGWTTWQLSVRSQVRTMRYRVEGPFVRDGLPNCVVFLIIIGGTTRWVGKRQPKRKQTKPCFYLVNAVQQNGGWQLPLPIPTLLAWLWQRWELEVTHRELKSGLGVGEIQCWSQRGAVLSVQWGSWFYAILVLAGYQAWGLVQGPPALGRWRRNAKRWSISTLLRGYRAALWGNTEFRACWSPSPDNWAEIDRWIQGKNNAVAAATRL
jgi:hypothetical protein